MTEEAKRTCAACVRSGLKHHHDIADFHLWYCHCAAQHVQWGAERTYDFDSLRIGFTPLGCNCNGKISFDGLAKIPRSSQVMVHPAVKNPDLLAARYLHVEDAGQVNTRLSNQVPAGLNHEPGPDKAWVGSNLAFQLTEAHAKDCHVQGTLVGEVGNAESSAEVETVQRFPESPGNAPANLKAFAVLGKQHFAVQNLSAREQMNTTKFYRWLR